MNSKFREKSQNKKIAKICTRENNLINSILNTLMFRHLKLEIASAIPASNDKKL